MQNHKDNFRVYDENALFELAVTSVIGNRKEQQDSVGFDIKTDEGLVVLCDGMGGHRGGKHASFIAVDMLLKKYDENYPTNNVTKLFVDTIEEIDMKIASFTDCNGEHLKAGSTIVSVIIKGEHLYWVSVGDSRIYIYREDELVQVTEDHIYQAMLDEQKLRGLIDDLDYSNKSRQGETLISFLGVNGLPKIDINQAPFTLLKDDKIILMTDGLYKLVSNEGICRILSNFSDTQDALNALELKAQKAAKNGNINRDNMTVALIKVK